MASDPVRIESLFEAQRKAKAEGATCFSMLKMGPKKDGKPSVLVEVAFFKSREADENWCLAEVSHWMAGYGVYKSLTRPFAVSLIKESYEEGWQRIEDIVV